MKEIGEIATIESLSQRGMETNVVDMRNTEGGAGRRCCGLTPRVILTAIITNLFAVGFGCVHRYMAPDNKSRRPFHLDYDEMTWRESIIPLGLAAGCLLSANLVDFLGRKLTILMASLVCIVGLTITAAQTSVDVMYAGMFVAGFGALVTHSAVTLYLSEIAPPAHRGRLLSLCALAVTVGELFVTLVGTALPWNWLAIFSAGFFAVSPTLLVFFPESPRWFLMKGNAEAAAESLSLFRGRRADCSEEMAVMKSALPTKLGIGRSACAAWKELVQPANLKSLALCSVLIVAQQFTGNQVLSVYRVILRGAADLRLNPYIINTITGLSSTIGGVACLLLIERLGRRVLIILSMACMSGSMVTYAVYYQLISDRPQSTMTWLPLSCVAVHNFSFRLGLWQIPNILLCELLPTGARGVGQAVVGSFANLVGFASLKSFFYIVDSVGFSGCFLIYTGVTLVGSLFAAIYVFDTSKKIMK